MHFACAGGLMHNTTEQRSTTACLVRKAGYAASVVLVDILAASEEVLLVTQQYCTVKRCSGHTYKHSPGTCQVLLCSVLHGPCNSDQTKIWSAQVQITNVFATNISSAQEAIGKQETQC